MNSKCGESNPCVTIRPNVSTYRYGALVEDRQGRVPEKPAKTCKECNRPYSPLRDGKCQPCYKRGARYGTTSYQREGIDDITVEFVLKHCIESSECLLWQDGVNREGRPHTSDRKYWREQHKTRQVPLHRWMYEHHTGQELRKGQNVTQTCGNKRCLAPAHLSTSAPRKGRTPLGDAGQYKGKQQRADHLESCSNGHPWTEETRYVDPAGRQSCRRCSADSRQLAQGKDPAEHEWNRRKSWEETPECAQGHLYEEVGWYFNGESRVCRKCFAKKERTRWLRVNYDMALEDFEGLMVGQDLKCAICMEPFSPEDRTPCVDHSHTDGRVRGLLCHACNLGIGHFSDNVDRLRSAITYLLKANAKQPDQ